MIDYLLIFATTYLLTWPALIALCVFGIWAERVEARGFAVFWALVAGVTAFFLFKVSLTDLIFYAIGYLIVGVIWSFYRYKRFIVSKVESILSDGGDEQQKNWRISSYHPTKMLDTITAWIIIWPFSLIENLCGDIINGIETLVKGVFKGVYNRIYSAAVADMIRKDEGVK